MAILLMMSSVAPAFAMEISTAGTAFELPVAGAIGQQISWSTAGYDGVPGLTREIFLQSDGYLYLESSSPLVPENWGYGIFLLGSFNDWDWISHDFNVTGVVGSNTFRLPIFEHPIYETAMASGNFQFGFYSWRLSEDAPMPITRAYLLIPSSGPTTPSAPQNFQAISGDGQVQLSWSAPSSDGGSAITRYEVSSNGGGTWVSTSMNTNHVFTGLINGTSYSFRVRAVNSVGNSESASATATPGAGGSGEPTFTDFIVIDQFGYRPEAQKIAVIRNPVRGFDSNLSFSPGTTYQVINESNGAVAAQGTPVHRFADDTASGDEIWHFNFSSVTQPGRYYILDTQRNVRSFSFTIADDVYNEVLKHAVRMFFYQRSGFEKETPYADPRWTDAAAFMHDQDSRFYLLPNRADLARDLHGAWFDAGDYNKYTAWTADYVESLLEIYRERPNVFGDDYNIPESGNGIPDILDEARWGMDWLLRIQNTNSVNFSTLGIPNYPTNITNFDGSVLSIVGYGAAGASPPSLDNATSAPSRYGPPNTISTIHAAKAFALGAIVFEEFDPAYAAILKDAAIRAYNWASANPEVYFRNNTASNNSQGLGAGNQDPNPDGADNVAIRPRASARMQAGLYLYELTGDAQYLQSFEQNNAYRAFPLFNWWVMDMYRFDTHKLYLHYLRLDGTNQTIRNDVRNQLNDIFHRSAAQGGNFAGRTQDSGYLAFMDHYPWGSNSIASTKGATFYYFGDQNIVIGSHTVATHKAAAENYLHYIHGVNPFNMVYLTNMNSYGASRSAEVIYHSWFSPWYRTGVSTAGSPPGFLPGGPNGGFNVDNAFPGNLGAYGSLPSNNPVRQNMVAVGHQIRDMQGGPPAKMYVNTDHTWPINSWEITEPMGAYQVNYIRLLSKFVQEQQITSPSGAQRPFGQTLDHGYAQLRVMPTNRSQEQMNQDIADQFNRILRHFVVETDTPRTNDKNEFLMVLGHYSGTGPVAPNPIMVCESQGFGMVMIAYMAGAEDMMVLSDPANSSSPRVPLRQRLHDNLPSGLRSQFGPDEVTFQVYFDAMFRTLRRFPTSQARTSHGPSTGSTVNATWAERTSNTATTIRSSYSGTINNPNYLMAWSLGSANGNGTQSNAANAVRNGAWSDTGSGASTATDGAMDMIYALLLADRQWDSPPAGRVNATSGAVASDSFYLYWAKGGMAQLQATCVNIAFPNTTNPLRNTVNGNWAQGANNRRITRPSDFFITHWKSFADSGVSNTVRSQWNTTIATTNHAVNSGSHPTTGILPDFLWFGADNLWRPLGPSPSDGISHWNENTTNDRLYAWNACRVPWRLGLDILHNGDDSPISATVQRLNQSMRTRTDGNWSGIQGGQLDGTRMSSFSGSAFQAPYLVTASAYGPASWLTSGWDWARGRTGFPDNYGDYILVLSMIAASGNWWCPITALNGGGTPVNISFNSLTANDGSATEATTSLTIVLDKAVPGLSASDITVTGATGGILTPTAPVYTEDFSLPLSASDTNGYPGQLYEISATEHQWYRYNQWWLPLNPGAENTVNNLSTEVMENARYLVVEFENDVTGTVGAAIGVNDNWSPGQQTAVTLAAQRMAVIDLNTIPTKAMAGTDANGYRIFLFRPSGSTVIKAFLSNSVNATESGTYTLDISGITVADNANITVELSKDYFIFSPSSRDVAVRNPATLSNACDILDVIAPSGASVVGLNITTGVVSNVESQNIEVTVSSGATWELHRNSTATDLIDGSTITLERGTNKVWIKVIAENGVSFQIYEMTIVREDTINNNMAAIPGVTAPVAGQTPVTTITATEHYTGTIEWTPNDDVFTNNTAYTATITLIPEPGWTFSGVGANFFNVAGATATNYAGSGVVTAVFPATELATLGGWAVVIGINEIGQNLTVDTNSVTGGSGAFSYQWLTGEWTPAGHEFVNIPCATDDNYTISGADAGRAIASMITRADATGSVIALFDDNLTVPFDIEVINSGYDETDTPVSLSSNRGRAGFINNITLYYVLGDGNGAANNRLHFTGGTGLSDVMYAGESTSQYYTVNPADAVNGKITIHATFQHTNLEFQNITFAQSHIDKTFGLVATFTQTVSGVQGTGALIYTSSNPNVATVTNDGVVTILGAGDTTITAEIAACSVYAADSASYTLTVAKGMQSAPTGINATGETAVGANDGTITGVTTDMEYKLSTAAVYTPVTIIPISNLAPGTYLVRFMETDNLNASTDATVTIEQAGHHYPTYTITFNLNGGVYGGEPSLLVQTVSHGGSAVAIDEDVITRGDRFKFNGWSSALNLDNITANRTFVAQWTLVENPDNPPTEMIVRVDVVNEFDSEMKFTGTRVIVSVEKAPINTTLNIETTISFTVSRPMSSMMVPFNDSGNTIMIPVSVPVTTNSNGVGTGAAFLTRNWVNGILHDKGVLNANESPDDVELSTNTHEGVDAEDLDFIRGDLNGDGQLTSADATMLARWLIATSEEERASEYFKNFNELAADINMDGKVDLNDLTYLSRWLVGLSHAPNTKVFDIENE